LLKKREMRYKWEKYKWWIYCVIIAIAAFLILHYVHSNTDQENARYILSAISQGLAAILALVFTITLVVSQMTRRYTATKKIILNSGTKFLMIVFGTGIILPLFALKFGWFCVGVNLSIVIACFCIALLLPFLKNVSDVLIYDVGYVNLYGEITDAIKSENEAKTVQGIIDLESICKDAIKESREEITSTIINFFSEIGEKTIETKLKTATGNLIVRLKSIGIEMVENGFEEATLSDLAGALSYLRIGAAENEWEREAKLATRTLKEIGCKAAEKELISVTVDAIEGLKHVGLEGIGGRNINTQTVRELSCLGAAVQKYLPEHVDHVIEQLRKLVTEAGLDRYIVERCGKDCISGYPHLESSFEDFKKRYKEG